MNVQSVRIANYEKIESNRKSKISLRFASGSIVPNQKSTPVSYTRWLFAVKTKKAPTGFLILLGLNA